jgi:hypothetical protein
MKLGSLALLSLAANLGILPFVQAETIVVQGGTIETGDILEGYPVITHLNATSLENGDYRFWFRGGENASKYMCSQSPDCRVLPSLLSDPTRTNTTLGGTVPLPLNAQLEAFTISQSWSRKPVTAQ